MGKGVGNVDGLEEGREDGMGEGNALGQKDGTGEGINEGDAVVGMNVGLPGIGVGKVEGDDEGGEVYCGTETSVTLIPTTTIAPLHKPLPLHPSCKLYVWQPGEVALNVIWEQPDDEGLTATWIPEELYNLKY